MIFFLCEYKWLSYSFFNRTGTRKSFDIICCIEFWLYEHIINANPLLKDGPMAFIGLILIKHISSVRLLTTEDMTKR